MEGYMHATVFLAFNMLLLVLKKMLWKLLYDYYILGQNKWTIFPEWQMITQTIIIYSDKIAADTNSVSSPQQNIFSTFIPSILFGHISASSDLIIKNI